MRVLLISSNTATTPYPVYPLGCSMIAAALTNAGHEVRQFDFQLQNDSHEALQQIIKEFKAELVGVSLRNIDNVILNNTKCYLEPAKEVVKTVRSNSDAVVIMGGAGFSLIPDLVLEETGTDYGIIGEGESLMVDFTNKAAKGIYPDKRLIGPENKLAGLDIPSAKYDNLLMEYYLSKNNIAPVQTKRGCTHSCVYCSYPVLEGARIRKRDPVSVVDDVELLYKRYHVKQIFFVDSVFNDDEGSYLRVIEEMRRRKMVIPWTAFFKPEGLDDKKVALMKQTGLVAVEFGSDAATDITLKKQGKNFSFNDIVESNNLLNKHEISVSHYFMPGGPGETKRTVLEGIENIISLKSCVSFIFMGIRILPNTALAALALKEGIISPRENLLKSVYYISPAVDINWLEETLTKAFSGIRHCIFPPDSMDKAARILYELGYSGSLWNMLIK